MVACRIALLSDLHHDPSGGADAGRPMAARGELLLERAVRYLNRVLRPDLTLLAGDLLEDPAHPEASERLARLARVWRRLEGPSLVLPGNHDPASELFYRHFERPPADWVELDGVRVLAFVDPQTEGFNARRPASELDRYARARADGFAGTLVSVQHVPLLRPGAAASPFGYDNADEALEALRAAGGGLALSGHFHPGLGPLRHEAGATLACPALCRPPFALREILIEDGEFEVVEHALALPDGWGLVDGHVHGPFSYCAPTMRLEWLPELARVFGLGGYCLTEHSSHLYFGREDYLALAHHRHGLEAAPAGDRRVEAYFEAARAAGIPDGSVGLELDVDFAGGWLLEEGDRARPAFCIGSIHELASLHRAEVDLEEVQAEFLAQAERLLHPPVRVLAHPFRILSGVFEEPPESLYRPLVALLRERGMAAELNVNFETPSPDFYRHCLERGVPLSLGSDAHRPADLGALHEHLRFLEGLGLRGDPSPWLLDPRRPRAVA